MTWIAPLLAVVLAAIVAGHSALRRALALALSLAALSAPYLHPDQPPLVRSLIALAAAGTLMRVVDLLFLSPRAGTAGALARVAHVVSIPDTFTLRRVRPSLAIGPLVRALGFAALAVAAFHVTFDVADSLPPPAAHFTVRWLGGATFIYAALDAAFAAIVFLHRLAGWDPGVMHRDPALARSIRELWGVRWSRVVSGWLGAHLFRPLARRGHAAAGLAASFLASALLHAYATEPGVGPRWAMVMGSFFLAQGLFAWLEGPLRVARWPAWAGHAWTIAVMLTTSPLFCEPGLRIVR